MEGIMEERKLAIKLAQIAENKKARNIIILKIDELTVISDYFVICSGTSTTHVKTLAEEMEFQMRQRGVPPRGVEGRESGQWLLLDYGGVVAHVFLPEIREFYGLERLWGDSERIDMSMVES